MATEPMLGVRILAGAVGLSLAGNRATVDRSMAKLRALAARADAAERLAKIADLMADQGPRCDDDEREHSAAVAAWRAITGEVQP